jgi:hypothetical protein
MLGVEALEDRTLLSPVLTATNLGVSGSNGAVVSNSGNFSDTTAGASVTLTASAGTVVQNSNGTWNWSETTPAGAAQTAPVTIYAKDSNGQTAATEFWLNVGQVFVVTNTSTDSNTTGSLAWALTQVSADTTDTAARPDLVAFNIPTSDPNYNPATGAFTIQLPTAYYINSPVVIDGYTQTGASPNTLLGVQLPSPGSPPTTQPQGDNAVLKIQIDLSAVASSGVGLQVNADNTTIRGLVVNNLTTNTPFVSAIYLAGQADHVEGNFIGTDVSGSSIVGGGAGTFGIHFNTSNEIVGGTTPDARNIIAGWNFGVGGQGVVEGNFIGTDASGTKPLGNQIGVDGGTVGGTVPGAGNLISGNQTGIFAANQVQGNLIGTYVTGTTALGNITGIDGGNLIGGTTAAARNIISGNSVGITDEGDLIEGNYIGTDISGTMWLANAQAGVQLLGGCTVGGTDPGTGNVIIAGSGGAIRGSGNGNLIEGNLIGTDYAGTQVIGSGIGINFQDGGNNNVIGGLDTNAPGQPLAGGGNLIFGGITFSNSGRPAFSGNVVEGNYIGTDITGTKPLGSFTGFGVFLGPGATNNTIASNIIMGFNRANDTAGIFIGLRGDPGPLPSGNAILGNSIYGNYVGISIASGCNNNQAAPVLTAAYVIGGVTAVTGTLTSTPNATFHLEFFANTTDDPEGRTFLGSGTVTTDATGHGSFTAVLAAPLPAGQNLVTATATDPNGNTSGFSAGVIATPLPPSSLSGVVWEDFNNDGQVDFGEKGISGVTITLTGTDLLGNAVNLSQLTDSDGAYVFLNLFPGNYTITETQPAGYLQGIDSVGTAGGSLSATDQFFVNLPPGVNGLNYNSGEQPTGTGPVQRGQTAGIGFWNNKNGQALILAFNGGSGTQLADWLAATLPNMFGANAGSNDLAGKSNAYVAALFQSDFVVKGTKLDAQVLATALSVYATNATLDNTGVAAKYGFVVSGDGVGSSTWNVGSSGDAFGVANNTSMTVMDLLLATEAQAINGLLYNGNTAKRNEANAVYSALNEAGSIS